MTCGPMTAASVATGFCAPAGVATPDDSEQSMVQGAESATAPAVAPSATATSAPAAPLTTLRAALSAPTTELGNEIASTLLPGLDV
jgi:hypothetical protein